MKKSILNLVGAQELTKNEQKSVNGGNNNVCSCYVWSGGHPRNGGYFICVTDVNMCQ